MGSSTIPAPSSGGTFDNWELISTASTGGASSLSFSSISGYQKLKVVWSDVNFVNLISCRINNDSGTNYTFVGSRIGTATASVSTDTFVNTAITAAVYTTFDWTIFNTNNANLKTYTICAFQSNGAAEVTGNYLAAAEVTSLNFAWSTGISTSVRLYGVRA